MRRVPQRNMGILEGRSSELGQGPIPEDKVRSILDILGEALRAG